MKIKTIKAIDEAVGGVLAACLPPARKKATAIDPRSILVIRPGGIGDAILLAPALLALKGRFPDARITVLAEQRNAAALELCPAVDRILLYHRKEDLWEAVSGGYHVVIDSEQWHRLSAVVVRLIGAPLSIGFATNRRSRLFSHPIGYSHDDYEMTSFFNLLSPLGIAPSAVPVPFLTVPEEASRRVEGLLPPSHFAVIFPGASIAERKWGADRFRQLAARLTLHGLPVVVVGGEEDAEEGHFIVRGCGGVNLVGETSLLETAAVIARSALLISGDSGLLHIGVGLGIPTVSLFGPGIEAKWGPKGEGHRVLNLKLPCSPCTRFGTTPPCPDKARCLSEIAVSDVVAAACELLERYRSPDR
jgi:ADP-heptose:LPS heptosyltransferase